MLLKILFLIYFLCHMETVDAMDALKRNPSLLDYVKSPMLMGYAPMQEYNQDQRNLQYLMYLRNPPRTNTILTFP